MKDYSIVNIEEVIKIKVHPENMVKIMRNTLLSLNFPKQIVKV